MPSDTRDTAEETKTPQAAGESPEEPDREPDAERAAGAEAVSAAETAEEVKEAEEEEATEEDPLQQALGKITSLESDLLYAKAEVQNVRNRAAKEAEKVGKYALDRFAQSLLPIVDSLEKAVELAGEDKSSPFAQGVEISLRMFLDVLAKEGITGIDPEGEPFDPSFHEAVSQIDMPDAEPNSVVSVLQKGFLLHDRLVRPAMVVVSRAATASDDDRKT